MNDEEPAGAEPVAIVGGRGKTGQAVADGLRELGCPSVPIGRTESSDLPAALRGCRAVYLMAPNMHPDEPQFVADYLDAARAAGIARVVYHSVGAPHAPEMPHHMGKAAAEDLVRRSGLDWTILQPCAYLDNLVPGLLADPPAISVAYSLDTPFGMVALSDVGWVAARVLTEPGHEGATYELGGIGPVSVRQLADAAAKQLDGEVAVTRISPAQWAAGPGAALDPREREWLLAMFHYYDRFGLPAGSLATRTLLNREPTGLAQILATATGQR